MRYQIWVVLQKLGAMKVSVPTHAAYSKNMRRDTHAEENDERTQDMMGPGVMPSTATQEGPVRFAEKTSRNTVPADLSWEKNTVLAEKYVL